MSSLDDAMQELNQGWYNALVTGLGLSNQEFQLVQGGISLGYDSEKIWNYLDSIPPLSINNYFNPSGYNSFSETYSAVINNLLPQDDDAMRKLLNDKYTDWLMYLGDEKKDPNPLPTTSDGEIDYEKIQIQKFQTWGFHHIDKSTIDAGTTLLKQEDAVSHALMMLRTAKNNYAYTATQQLLKDALDNAPSKSVVMDSTKQNYNISESWAKLSISGFYGAFYSEDITNWRSVSETIYKNGLHIEAKFSKVTVLPGKPFEIKSGLSSDLVNFNPWFYSPALALAKKHKNDNNVWKHTAPTWDDTFGTNGNLLRLMTGLVVVDGIDITITTKINSQNVDEESFKKAVSAGFWPFITGQGSGGKATTASFKDDGTCTIESHCAKGNPNVIGVLVNKIDSILS